MEGLFIASILEDLRPRLPARNLGWAFPDETTAALLLEGNTKGARPFNLVLSYHPPTPALYLNQDRLEGNPRSPFQRALEGKLQGPLLSVEQLKLDRVIELGFGPGLGFIETPALRLLFELTGRNANLLLLEPGGTAFEGRVLQAGREISNARNRFRQVRSGGPYTPPPPYQKLDPRHASQTQLKATLAGVPLLEWHKHIDGLGPTLSAEIINRSKQIADQALNTAALETALNALNEVVRNPQLSNTTASTLSEQARQRAQHEKQGSLRKALREPLEKRLQLLKRQLEDVDRAREEALQAIQTRELADTLLAYAHEVPGGASSVTLENVHGSGPVTIALEPKLDAAANANRFYARAKRREDVLEKLEIREPELQGNHTELTQLLAKLETMSLADLEQMLQSSITREERPAVGLRYRTSNGLEVLVGRNAKENDLLTHRIAKSWDLWFHVQGYPGSHTVLRTQNREAQFPDVLEAARIAAHHSKARGSGNIAVDYVPLKNLWRPKGGKSGAVYFTGQKTVYVDAELPKRQQA